MKKSYKTGKDSRPAGGDKKSGSQPDALSYPVSVDVLPAKGFRVEFDATEEERTLLAQFLGVENIDSLRMEFILKRWRKDGVALKGKILAKLIQACVVSLEPVASDIDVEVDRLFAPEASRLLRPDFDNEGEIVINMESSDPPDPFSGSQLDIWEVVKEELALAVDPFPRHENAGQEAVIVSGASKKDRQNPDEEERQSPFSMLERLKFDRK